MYRKSFLPIVFLLFVLGCSTIPEQPLTPEARTIDQPLERVRQIAISRAHARGYMPVEGQDLTFDRVVWPSGDPILGIFPGNTGGLNSRARFTLMSIDSKTTKLYLDPLLVVNPRSNSPRIVSVSNRSSDRTLFRAMLDDIEREAATLPIP